ncbi:MAG TPA: ABC transporter substrate-binding protein [Pyrinomonadaceae bacterium]|nr:ABC transporter substrate-binding protein [Pyrinomonadaceae bacterium]
MKRLPSTGLLRGSRAALLLAAACALLLAACADRVYVGHESNANAPRAGLPQRIISLSPSATEVLYGVGAFDRVVAVTDYDEFPPEVARLPKVGGWSNTNLEQIATLRPDLVVMTESQSPLIKDKLDALGVRTLTVPSYTVADALSSITQIGAATGQDEQARKLLAETQARLDEVRARTKDLKRPRVLCIVDRVPGTLRGLYTATEGSFIDELIEIAGGDSIAPPARTGFGQINKEAIATLDPEIIIDMAMGARATNLAEDPKQVWAELGQVRAVREGRVHAVSDASVIHPSQFVADAALKFAELIHPEVFAAKK